MESLTRSQVAEHNSNNSAWMVIGNHVYDLTKFLDEVYFFKCFFN